MNNALPKLTLKSQATILCLALATTANAAERAMIDGTVRFGDTPLCAMVLANGQSMFSCSGDGRYALDVPLDDNGEITLFSFASGFAPYKQVLTPAQAVDFTVAMERDAGSNALHVVKQVAGFIPNNRADITGSVDFQDTPVCAFILANGQSMFSCGDSLGKFDLQVPKDDQGQITLFVFASGFQPYKLVIDAERSPLNDTGILSCADDLDHDLNCPVNNYPGQDAEYGKDAVEPDDSDGHAGFRFRKLDRNGEELPANADNWSCVRDDQTLLTWEVKTLDGGLHHRDDRYSWYNTDSNDNGGHPGFADTGGALCFGYLEGDPEHLCNTQDYLARVNQEGWCGYHDWRLPTRSELLNLTRLDTGMPSIDSDYFPNMPTDSGYWTRSPTAVNPLAAWIVHFDSGTAMPWSKSDGRYIRLVRGGQ